MIRHSIIPVIALAMAACQTPTERSAKSEALAAEIAAKKGDSVNQICFLSSIGGWRALDRDNLLLRRGVNDWYLLELSGTCDPQWAMNAIGLRTRSPASSCLSRGDKIETYDTGIGGSCFISRIYEWDDDALEEEAED